MSKPIRNLVVLSVLALAALAAGPAGADSTATAPAADAKPLYQRLGGYDAIAAVTDDFIARLASDATLTRFFGGHSTDSLKRLRQHVVDQLCAATGGPCIYNGRDMKTVHAGLNINESDWKSSVKHLVDALDKFKVPQKEKDDLLAIAGSLHNDIVTAPAQTAGTTK